MNDRLQLSWLTMIKKKKTMKKIMTMMMMRFKD